MNALMLLGLLTSAALAAVPNLSILPGASPAGVAADSQGNIYGTTLNGGTYGFGVVWEISP